MYTSVVQLSSDFSKTPNDLLFSQGQLTLTCSQEGTVFFDCTMSKARAAS